MDLPQLRARVSADLADVVGWLGDFDLARTCFEDAAELSRRGADALLTARAEVGIAMWANPFLPDPSRLRRLERALAALPAEELRLRAALLGRLAVVAGPQLDADDRGPGRLRGRDRLLRPGVRSSALGPDAEVVDPTWLDRAQRVLQSVTAPS